jgi:hypothetical protein
MYVREPFSHTRLKIREFLGLEAQFHRLTRWETVRKVVYDGYSLSRYGDGELGYFLKKKGLYFQPYYQDLGQRLHEHIMTPKDGVLTCFSNDMRDMDRYFYIDKAVIMSGKRNIDGSGYSLGPDKTRQRRTYVERWIRIARQTQIRIFGDTNCFRIDGFFNEFENGQLDEVKADFQALFRNRRILFVCPKTPKGGASFEALEPELRNIGLRDAQYIFIPEVDAALVEGDIRREIEKKSNYDDIFIQAGPLATVLAYELAGTIDGRVIDSGRLNNAVPYLATS